MARAARDTGVGRSAVKSVWVATLAGVFALIAFLLIYAVMAFWPPTVAADADATQFTVQFLGFEPVMQPEQGLLMIVALAGGLGAMGHVLRSFSAYVGERHLVWSWVPSYLLTPIVGALFATVTYILIRAGLITGSAPSQGNPFGFAAIAALVGLFSAQAASKLKDVFETIFSKLEGGAEAIGESAPTPPSITAIIPDSATEGDEVEILGAGLDTATEVAFSGGVVSPATFDETTGTLKTTVPQGALSGPVSVTVDSTTTASHSQLTVSS